MGRDRTLLSDYEYYRNVLDTIEFAVGTKIKLTMFRGDNYVKYMDRERLYIMNIARPTVRGIPSIVAFAHECGHILGRSPITTARKILTKWADVLDNSDDRYEMYWSAYNIIEDQRIEQFIADIWLAYFERFVDTRTVLGEGMKILTTPIDELLAIRFFKKDLVKSKRKKIFTDVLDESTRVGRFGCLKLLARIKPLLDEWFDDEYNNHSFKYREISTMDSSADDDTDVQMMNDMFDASDLEKTNSLSIDEGERERELDKIRDALDKFTDRIPNTKSIFRNIRRHTGTVEYNSVVSTGLKKFLRRIKEKQIDTHSYDGKSVDIERYIENKLSNKNRTKVMLDKRPDEGISIVLSIDGSGSMNIGILDNISMARKLVATLYKAIEGYRGIEIKANVWGSNGVGDVGITDINNYDECKYITIAEPFKMTPTHLAIEYSSDVLYKMRGIKKLLILITDGKPEYRKRNYKLSADQLIGMTKKSLVKARARTPNIICILLAPRKVDDETKRMMNAIFGKKYITVKDMDGAEEKVIKEFKHLVSRYLK